MVVTKKVTEMIQSLILMKTVIFAGRRILVYSFQSVIRKIEPSYRSSAMLLLVCAGVWIKMGTKSPKRVRVCSQEHETARMQ